MIVVLDTNALLLPFDLKVDPYVRVKDLIPGVELVTLQGCVNELKGLRPGQWESILQLGLDKGLKVVDSGLRVPVDDRIVAYAKARGAVVLTQDQELKKKLLNTGLRLIILRQQKYFMLTG